MFDGCYAETLVHKRSTSKDLMGKYSIIGLMVAFGLMTVIFVCMMAIALALVSFAIFAIFFFLTLYYVPRFKIDWEYVFVDGQLDFDQILGGNGRKRKLRVDFDHTEIVAKTGSHHLDQYEKMSMKTLDYSSLEDNPTYTIICHEGNDLLRILFEPDENMIETMRNKSPRKVKRD